MTFKERYLEEAVGMIMPALIPEIQSNYAKGLAENIKSKSELEDFKKEYPDYKNYDQWRGQVSRRAKYGVLGGSLISGLVAANGEYDWDTLAGIPAMTTGVGILGGTTLPFIRSKLQREKTLADIIKEKEKGAK
jgi:hypothetical protein